MVPWNKGSHFSDEAKEKMRVAKLGKPRVISDLERRRQSERSKLQKNNLGKKFSKEVRLKMSVSHKGRKLTSDWKRKISNAHIGKIYSKTTIQKMKIAASKRIAKTNAKNPSGPEILMAGFLQENGFEYSKQFFPKIPKPYPADFFLPSENIIIEVDGKYWHNYPHGKEIDHKRNEMLKNAGYKVLRFWEGEFNKEIVLQRIKEV